MSFPQYDAESLTARGVARAKALPRRLGVEPEDVHGKRLLEFGCGHGEVTVASRHVLSADAIGIDLIPRWERTADSDTEGLYVLNVLDGWPFEPVDFIQSYTVFEHVERPIETMGALFDLLRPGGRAYLSFNLYRGASAAHLRQRIDIPWIHLLHSDEEIREMMIDRHGIDRGPTWVNKMTYLHYLHHFAETGFVVESHWYDRTPMSDEFYEQHRDALMGYPRYELERNFMHVRLSKPDEDDVDVAENDSDRIDSASPGVLASSKVWERRLRRRLARLTSQRHR